MPQPPGTSSQWPPGYDPPVPGSVARLKRLLTQIPAGLLTDAQFQEIDYLIALHRHVDPWVKGIARRLGQMNQGQEQMF